MKRIEVEDFVVLTSNNTYKDINGSLMNNLHSKRLVDKMIKELVKELKK